MPSDCVLLLYLPPLSNKHNKASTWSKRRTENLILIIEELYLYCICNMTTSSPVLVIQVSKNKQMRNKLKNWRRGLSHPSEIYLLCPFDWLKEWCVKGGHTVCKPLYFDLVDCKLLSFSTKDREIAAKISWLQKTAS